jgi:hypothetical protein
MRTHSILDHPGGVVQERNLVAWSITRMKPPNFIIDALGDVPCDGEENLMLKMREMAGPWAEESKLRVQLRCARGKAHWAINTYLREALSEEVPSRRLDFEPQSVLGLPSLELLTIKDDAQAGTSHVKEATVQLEGEDSGSLDDWAPQLLTLLLEHIVDDPWSLISASCTSKAFLKASRSEKLWKDMFNLKWPAVFPLSQGISKKDWIPPYALFRDQSLLVHRMTCPVCGVERGLVPIVYGFPSAQLMTMMKNKKCILGGDHLIEDCHMWCCHQCGESFKVYPYSSFEWINTYMARSAATPAEGMRMRAYTYEL